VTGKEEGVGPSKLKLWVIRNELGIWTGDFWGYHETKSKKRQNRRLGRGKRHRQTNGGGKGSDSPGGWGGESKSWVRVGKEKRSAESGTRRRKGVGKKPQDVIGKKNKEGLKGGQNQTKAKHNK